MSAVASGVGQARGQEMAEPQHSQSEVVYKLADAIPSVLQKNLARTRTLIETIDKTIKHLKGTKKMKSEEMFVGFSVAAGDDRFGEHIILGGPGGEPIDCKVSAQDTDGAMSVFEFNCQSGGPRHLHYEQDE